MPEREQTVGEIGEFKQNSTTRIKNILGRIALLFAGICVIVIDIRYIAGFAGIGSIGSLDLFYACMLIVWNFSLYSEVMRVFFRKDILAKKMNKAGRLLWKAGVVVGILGFLQAIISLWIK